MLPSAGALVCGVDVAEGDIGELRDAFEAAEDAPAGCEEWEIRISGTFSVTPAAGPLVHEEAVALRVVGPAGGTARIEASGDGTRLIDALDGGRLTVERVVLAGGSVQGLEVVPPVVDDFIAFGGAILGDVVELIDSEVIGSSADAGGAVFATGVRAERTSFVENGALGDIAEGGAIRATGSVTLVNATFAGNVAGKGGAVWLAGGASLDATFVTFRANTATAGADLHVDAAPDDLFRLRGVLFGGTTSGASCGGDGFPSDPSSIDVQGSFAVDGSCTGVTEVSGPLTFTTVPFLAGTTPLPVPDGGPASIGQVACGAGWPAVDQRGVARPQGDTCDAGAVEREVVVVPPPPPPPPVPPVPDTQPEPATEAVVGGPVPTSVPAGDGTCADGCPTFGSG